MERCIYDNYQLCYISSGRLFIIRRAFWTRARLKLKNVNCAGYGILIVMACSIFPHYLLQLQTPPVEFWLQQKLLRGLL